MALSNIERAPDWQSLLSNVREVYSPAAGAHTELAIQSMNGILQLGIEPRFELGEGIVLKDVPVLSVSKQGRNALARIIPPEWNTLRNTRYTSWFGEAFGGTVIYPEPSEERASIQYRWDIEREAWRYLKPYETEGGVISKAWERLAGHVASLFNTRQELIGVRTGPELREAERELLGILAVIGYKEFEAAGKGVVQLRYVEGQQGLRMVKPKQVVAMYEPENGNGQVTLRAVPESMYPSVLRKFADGRYSPLVVLEQLGER